MDTIEALVDIPSVGFPVWSPDGRALAYLLDRPGAGWQLWRCDLPGGERRPLSERPVAGARPSWSPDGRRLAVVRGNAEGGSDVWLIDATGAGEERRLAGGAWETRSPSFSPDGTRLACISGQAGSLDVWVIDVDGGGDARRLTAATNPLDEPRWTPRWSPDGGWIAYVSSRSGERNNDDVWVVSADGARHRQLTTGLLVNTDPVWSPDGQALAVVANTVMEHWYGDDADLWRVPFAPGPAARLTPGGGHSWRLEGAGVAWAPDGAVIYALSLRDGDKNVTAVPADGRPRTAVTSLEGSVTDFAVSPDGRWLAYVLATQTSPPDLFVVPLAGGLPRRLTDCRRAVETPPRPRRVPYRSFDGLYCAGYLYLPPDFDEDKLYPGLVQVHGGGTNAYGNGWHPVEQWLARHGFVVLAIEYRGSSGYGRDFAGLSYGDWGGGQTRDAVAAGAWLKSQPFVGKVGLYGGSYGGYLTLHGIVAAPELFDAAVDMYGNTNKVTAHQYCDRVGRVFVARDYWGRFPEEMPELMERASTYHSLDQIKTPLLIMHGDRDPRVPPEESEQVAAAMRANGLAHEYVVYPGEGHGFRKREHRIDCYTRMLRWFRTYLTD